MIIKGKSPAFVGWSCLVLSCDGWKLVRTGVKKYICCKYAYLFVALIIVRLVNKYYLVVINIVVFSVVTGFRLRQNITPCALRVECRSEICRGLKLRGSRYNKFGARTWSSKLNGSEKCHDLICSI